MIEGYSGHKAAELSGVPQPTFWRYAKRGIIVHDVADAKGNLTMFSDKQVELAKKYRAESSSKKECVTTTEETPTDNKTVSTNEDDIDVFELLPTLNELNDVDDEDEDVIEQGTMITQSETTANETSTTNEEKIANVDVDGAPVGNKPQAVSSNNETAIVVDKQSITLDERANKIRRLQADVQRGIIDIGFELIAAKKEIGHGQWQIWLATEFDWTDRTARNFMAIAERYGNRKTFSDLKPATLIKMLALPEGDEQNFIDEQTAAGRPIETQSAREVQRNVKAWKEQHAPADDDSSNVNSSFEEIALVDVSRIAENNHGKITAVVMPYDEEDLINDTAPASSPMIETSYNIAADFIIFSKKDIEYIRTVTIELATKGDLETLKWWHDRLLEFAQELGEQVLLVKTKCDELLKASADVNNGSKPL